ncbi:MAG: threonine--tRNA ligase [Candidatus Saccharibacteria bacterium]|nr:threonine--tRNA ligase [Candidatus Saccharibacteria bacterium]
MSSDEQNNKAETIRHSLAHIMAAAVQKLWPQAEFGVGPSVENGFYYDIYLENYAFSDQDLKKIEKRMHNIINQKLDFIKRDLSIEEAINWAKQNNQRFKVELLDDLKKHGTTKIIDLDEPEGKKTVTSVSFYQVGDFVDLCRGLHVSNTSEINAFKLMRVSGAYWRGDEKREQMQRIYGVAFETQSELDEYLERLEQAKMRDHRKLGKELDLFTFSPLVGAGLPMFTPRGTILRDLLSGFTNQCRQDIGFTKVWTPNMTKHELYEKSGHWAKFGSELFLVKSQETSDQFVMKPMNCPHHAQIYVSKPRSYKEMPIRYLETTTDYRDEKTGELGGLSRVRSLTQDDSHVFCRPDQIGEEIHNLMGVADKVYATFGMKLRVRLSYRDDSDAYLGDAKLWEESQKRLKEAVIAHNLDYFEQTGEAAFYGPKIDFMASDALGREHQVATVQLDFVQPERFGLTYIDHDGKEQQPIMIHCAILGSIERFMSVFIEHTSGHFPLWIAPEQIRILTINDDILPYAQKIKTMLDNIVLNEPVRFNPLRVTIDSRKESLGKKIREATSFKIPIQLIVGQKDNDAQEVSIRLRDGEQKIKLSDLESFLQRYNAEETNHKK